MLILFTSCFEACGRECANLQVTLISFKNNFATLLTNRRQYSVVSENSNSIYV